MDMTRMKIWAILSSAFSMARLLFSISWIWITLGWRVGRARSAFEKQLIKAGMSRSDANRLSEQYICLKDEIMNVMWSSMRKR